MMNKVNVTNEGLLSIARFVIESLHHIKRMMRLAQEISVVVTAKNHDYGDAWQRYGIYTPLVRLNDKLLRVQTLTGGEQALVSDEGITDTLQDIVAYGLLALLWLDQNKNVADRMVQLPLFNPEAVLQTIVEDDGTISD
jgi:hypothetical protein